MTYYLNTNSDYKLTSSNNNKNIIDNENFKLNFKGTNIETHHSLNNQKSIIYFNNDNYDLDFNYQQNTINPSNTNTNPNNSNNNNSNKTNYYRNENSRFENIQNCFINKILNNNNNNNNSSNSTTTTTSSQNNANEIFISSSSDNDEKIEIDDDYDNELIKTMITDSSSSIINFNSSIQDLLNNLVPSVPTAKLEILKCRYLSKFLNYYKNNKLNKFEDLQKFFIILRKTLNKIKLKNSYSTKNEDDSQYLAFDNLTYSSSVEDLSSNIVPQSGKNSKQQTAAIANDLSKKTLKSIKRKDKLKKETKITNNENNTSNTVEDRSRSRSRSRQRVEATVQKAVNVNSNNENDFVLSNKEFEKQLKKKYRCKSVARSIRRAKTVYYRNRRSKSLENLSALTLADLKLKYPEENEENLNKLALSRANNIMSSCSSFTSATSCVSDISSSYFHELSDWSPNFSDSDSVDSNSLSLEDVDWDANLHDIPLSEYYSSSDEEFEEDEDDDNEFECDCKFCNTYNQNVIFNDNNNLIQDEIYNQLQNQKNNLTFHVLESMLKEIMSQMLKLHPGIFRESIVNCPASSEFIEGLPITQVTTQYLNENKTKHDCSICLASFEIQEDTITLPCCHVYHGICIKVWLSKSATCPICRYNYSNGKNNNNNTQMSSRETLI